MSELDIIRDAIKDYRIASYEEQKYFEVCEDYELLIGPDGFKCALTEPEDRTFYRDLSPVIFELNRLKQAIAALSTIKADAKPQEPSEDAEAFCKRHQYLMSPKIIQAHDDAIRRDCADRAVKYIYDDTDCEMAYQMYEYMTRKYDDIGSGGIRNEPLRRDYYEAEPAREESE